MPALVSPRSYLLPNGDRLVERDYARATGFPNGSGQVNLADGSTIEPRTFELVDAQSNVKRSFGQPRAYALDDYLYVSDAHFVRGGALCRCTLSIGGAGSFVVRATDSTEVLTGLEPLL
jgi:hypothetical protein